MTNEVLNNIRTRRVVREMSEQPVERAQIETLLEAARWAPTGGNTRQNRFVVIEDAEMRRLVRLVSPGMFQQAPVLILVCTDHGVVARHEISPTYRALMIDIGIAAQTIMLAAHSIGLASGPVTSYSKEAVRVIANLPHDYWPEMILCIGHKAENARPGMKAWDKITWRDLTRWDRLTE